MHLSLINNSRNDRGSEWMTEVLNEQIESLHSINVKYYLGNTAPMIFRLEIQWNSMHIQWLRIDTLAAIFQWVRSNDLNPRLKCARSRISIKLLVPDFENASNIGSLIWQFCQILVTCYIHAYGILELTLCCHGEVWLISHNCHAMLLSLIWQVVLDREFFRMLFGLVKCVW